MKNTFAKVLVLVVVSYAITHSFGQDGTNRIGAAESSFKGALIIVKPTEESYQSGKPMPVSITITNIGETDMRLVGTLPEEDDYRVSVCTTDGTPVRSPSAVGDMSNGVKSRSILTIRPGQSVTMALDLAKLIHIEGLGTYYLTVARRILTWDSGFVVSDKVRVNVVAPIAIKPEK